MSRIRQAWSQLWWALLGAYNHRRLASEIAEVAADLDRHILRKGQTKGTDVDALREARNLLDQSYAALQERDPEKGWRLLLAAQREAVWGLDEDALTDRARVLLIEAEEKLKGWRLKAVQALLSDQASTEQGLSNEAASSTRGSSSRGSSTRESQDDESKTRLRRLDQAMGILHEHFSNGYLRIAMVREQVLILSGMALVILGVLIGGIAGGWVELGTPVLADARRAFAIALLGGLGGSLVAIYSTVRSGGRGRIPDLIGNRPFAVMRPVVGAASALAVVVLFGAAAFTLTAAAAAAVAVAAGFSELLLEKAVDSVSNRPAS